MHTEKIAFKNFNLSVLLHFIGRFLYAIFIPIILLKNNYSLNLVLAYFLLSSLVTIFTSYTAQKIFSHQRAIIFNIFAIVSEIILVILFSYNHYTPVIFWLILIFEGVYASTYYISYFSIISHYTNKEKIGGNLGNLKIAVTVAGITAPLIGAILLDVNQIYLILISTLFLILSAIPLIPITNSDINGDFLKKIKFGDTWLAYIKYGVISAIEIIIFNLWAVYAFLSGFSLISIGTITIASGLAEIAISQKLKGKIDSKNYRIKLEIIALLLVILASVYRFSLPNHIIISNLIFGGLFLTLNLCAETALMKETKGYQTYHSSALMSITTFTARALMVTLTFVLGLKNIILIPILLAILYMTLLKKK